MKQIIIHTTPTTRYRCSYTVAVLLLGLYMLLVSCSKDKEQEEPVIKPLHTLLFYMGGDNNLSSEVAEKIACIKSASLSSLCHVVIYKDTRDGNPQLLELKTENGMVKTTIVRDYEETNSASAENFSSVLHEVRARFPTPSYGLVLFSHASGWLPEGTYSNPAKSSGMEVKSIIIDKKSEMELSDFANAIPDSMFDFIIFEACHMAGIEVAWELKNKTQYIIASSTEIVSPGFSPTYALSLSHLFNPYNENLLNFCRAIEMDYRTRVGDESSLTLSLIKTKNLDILAASLQDCLRNSIHAANTKKNEGDGTHVQSFDRNGKDLFFDFGDYYASLIQEPQLKKLQTAIENCVIWKSATVNFMPTYGGFNINSHSGLSTYIPQEKYPNLNEAYKQLKWYKEVLSLTGDLIV